MSRTCTTCGESFDANIITCPHCGAAPVTRGDYPLFAPALAESAQGFDPSYFETLAGLEEGSFWFVSRNRLILWALERFFTGAESFLEIGCGTGYVLSGIERSFPGMSLSGSEVFVEGLEYVQRRTENTVLFQMDARDIPFENEFDVIGAFDILEHVEEDEIVINEMYRAVVPGGGVLLTVPQHGFLWSHTDEYACHVRRYEARDLLEKLSNSGFRVIYHTSFVSLLLPLVLFARLAKPRPTANDGVITELKISGFLNKILTKVMDIELFLIRAGIHFPLGSSLLVAAVKDQRS